MKLLRILLFTGLMLVALGTSNLIYLDKEFPVQSEAQATHPVIWFPRYRIEAVFNPAHRRMEGTLFLVYRNTGAEKLDELQFSLIGNILLQNSNVIRVTRTEINGQDSKIIQEPRRVVVPLKYSLLPGEEITAELHFQTVIPKGPGRLGSKDGVYSLTAWYPVLAPVEQGQWANLPWDYDYTYGDPYYTGSAYYEGSVKLPASMQVLAGIVLKETSQGRWKTWSFAGEQPLREFAMVFSESFRYQREIIDGINVIYAFTGSPKKEVLPAAIRSLRLFNGLLGSYPYEQLALVETPLSGLSGMEYPGLILLREDGGYAEYTVSHEVAHQWWYGLVGNNQIKEPWIDESLANYAALLYLRKYKPAEYLQRFVGYEDRVFGQRMQMNRELGEYRTAEEYREAVYVKGALFWEHLGNLIGEEKLMEVLRWIQGEYRHREINTEILLNAVEEKTDIDPLIIERLLNN
ncbi:MAG: M1 family metallopeptidase [Bacillota bacterium]